MLLPFIKKGILPLLLFLSLLLSSTHAVEPDGSDAYGLTPFYVIHSPKYDLQSHGMQDTSDYTVGLQFEDVEAVYMLSNAHSPDSIVFSGLGLANMRYHYTIFDKNGEKVSQEMFYREPCEESKYDIYGQKKTVKSEQWYTLPPSKDSFEGESTSYPDRLDRQLVHPINEIPTFHLHADATEFKRMMDNVDEEELTVTADLTRIISGQTSRYFDKKSFTLSLPESGGSINGFKKFKLRSMVTDPSRLREKLYYDLSAALGVPTAHASYVRLYVNDRPAGLYLLIDNYKGAFLSNVFGLQESRFSKRSGDNQEYVPTSALSFSPHGGLIQGLKKTNQGEGGNLECLGSTWKDHKSFYKISDESQGSRDIREAFVEFLEFIEGTKADDLDGYFHKWFGHRSEEKLIQEWEARFDVTVFLKNIALEIILGGTDGYLGAAHNYFLYQDLNQNGRFIWLPSDFDMSQGSTMIPKTAGTNALDIYGLLNTLDKRPLVQQILKIPTFKARFMDIIYDIYKNYFESGALAVYIQFETALIKDDASWDDYIWADDEQEVDASIQDRLMDVIGEFPLSKDFVKRLKAYVFQEGVFGVLSAHESLISILQYYRLTQENLFKIIAQIVVSLGSVVTRAFVAAYKQAAANAARGGGPAASGGKTGTKEAVLDALTRKTNMTMEEACQILNVTKEADLTKLTKNYEHLFGANDPTKGGSFYIQSKVVRAKERIDLEKAEELKSKAAEEAAAAAAKNAETKTPPPPSS
ncbi:coth-domain-containing protein [Backusella circina FSU 941]|nr:coth-domain-containing protein [Backusella circina FSU 941]